MNLSKQTMVTYENNPLKSEEGPVQGNEETSGKICSLGSSQDWKYSEV